MVERKELIKKYIEFFKEKDHKEIKNASLIPENDPTVLFTTAGMHPLVPFLLGQEHPQGKRLCNVQKCLRTQDIEEVGDTYHHTFFEMLGNWSLGDYFKEEAIKMSFEFLTRVLEIPVDKLAVSCFKGDEKVPKDTESYEVWKSLGVKEKRIVFLEEDNWWGPAGKTGPCGPDTEMFYWKSSEEPPEEFDPEDERWVEVWNDVLMEYNKDENGNYNEASQKNIDTGMGLERTVTVLNGLEDNYLSGVFKPIIEKIEELSGREYGKEEGDSVAMRVIADHIKTAVFILGEGVKPSNTEHGYILRRVIRRMIRFGRFYQESNLRLENFITEVAKPVFDIYDDYEHLRENKDFILEELRKEEEKFNALIQNGMKVFEKISKGKEEISGKNAFLLYQSYGFPIEMTMELAKERGIKVDEAGFNEEFKRHQELSRTASQGKFKSGLADDSETTKKLHTATHLLNQALREVLGSEEIYQKGSNITPERLRFDFNFERKLSDEEKKKVEEWINDKIEKALPVRVKEMSVEEANEIGAVGVFDAKYGEKVKVYFVGNEGEEVSKEICAGPHVENTKELGKFRIKKEESSSSGVRRIKAVLD